jgi:hypothetical protein
MITHKFRLLRRINQTLDERLDQLLTSLCPTTCLVRLSNFLQRILEGLLWTLIVSDDVDEESGGSLAA